LAGIVEESRFEYDTYSLESSLSVIIADNERTESVSEGQALLVFAQTPFYAELGGQVADHGVIKNDKGDTVAEVVDVQKAPNGQPLHTVS
ncbi:alanine--tRNA ligase-related protein, partial [Listeria monocytogenes]|nr:alanine--tRNA ligase-related protein [Listeria monocytogenes]